MFTTYYVQYVSNLISHRMRTHVLLKHKIKFYSANKTSNVCNYVTRFRLQFLRWRLTFIIVRARLRAKEIYLPLCLLNVDQCVHLRNC